MKFKVSFWIVAMLLFCAQRNFAQAVDTLTQKQQSQDLPYPWSKKKEVALNVTNLAKLFVPLNFSNVTNQDVILKTKWYFKKVALRIDFGADLDLNDELSPDGFYLAIGYERRRAIYKDKWFYTTGWSGVITGNENDGVIGVLKHFGMEYNLHPSVTLGTDTGLLFGVFTDDFNLKLVSPTSLFLQMRF
ncbi:MAG TPA: hypothetical protein PLY70_15645 [Saprospiraceae bacterium]|nr:hypothetical protein [Saprospiraceae bacterium]